MSWSGRSAVSYVSFLIRCVGPLSVCAWPTMRLSPFWPKRNRGRQPIPAATERWHTHCALVEQPIRQADGGMRLTCILKTHKQRQDRQAQAHMTFWMCVADNKTVVIKITTARSACFGLLPHVILLVNWEETFFFIPIFNESIWRKSSASKVCLRKKKYTKKLRCDWHALRVQQWFVFIRFSINYTIWNVFLLFVTTIYGSPYNDSIRSHRPRCD